MEVVITKQYTKTSFFFSGEGRKLPLDPSVWRGHPSPPHILLGLHFIVCTSPLSLSVVLAAPLDLRSNDPGITFDLPPADGICSHAPLSRYHVRYFHDVTSTLSSVVVRMIVSNY